MLLELGTLTSNLKSWGLKMARECNNIIIILITVLFIIMVRVMVMFPAGFL